MGLCPKPYKPLKRLDLNFIATHFVCGGIKEGARAGDNKQGQGRGAISKGKGNKQGRESRKAESPEDKKGKSNERQNIETKHKTKYRNKSQDKKRQKQ